MHATLKIFIVIGLFYFFLHYLIFVPIRGQSTNVMSILMRFGESWQNKRSFKTEELFRMKVSKKFVVVTSIIPPSEDIKVV